MTEAARPRPRPSHYLYQDAPSERVRRPLWRRLLLLALALGCFGGVACAVGVGAFLWSEQRSPREWAPYLQRRADRHRAAIVDSTNFVAGWLVSADRMAAAEPPEPLTLLGASAARSGPLPAGTPRPVASMNALAGAISAAQPGDVIVVQPGHYQLNGYSAIVARNPGTAIAPITVRAARLGDVTIDADMVEVFKVTAPYWHIENLVVRGVCSWHSGCEHAIHVGGAATDTVIRNNRFEDFNAQVKVNSEGGLFPDRGVIEGNTFTDTFPRETGNPITPIDLVAASEWSIRGNFIADFVRADPGGATYGAFVKGAGENNVMERNLVICEWHLRGGAGQHVGLSLGGGGTDQGARREFGKTGFEQVGGVIRDNLIVGCSDDGIYVNRAARSVIDHNTILDTAGVDVRFVESSATVTGNIVDGVVRKRDGAGLNSWDNDIPWFLPLFAGWHPQRAYFRDPARLDLRWRADPPKSLEDTAPRPDLCGRPRGSASPPGAFADFAACLAGQ